MSGEQPLINARKEYTHTGQLKLPGYFYLLTDFPEIIG
jgi:hypothetical protein